MTTNANPSEPFQAMFQGSKTTGNTGTFNRESPPGGAFETIQNQLRSSSAVENRPHIKIRGEGNVKIRWIALLDERETTWLGRGVYCCFLFREDMTGVYLVYEQGVTELMKNRGLQEARQALRETAQVLRRDCRDLTQNGFLLDNQMDLKNTYGPGENYQAAAIAYKFYDASAIPPTSTILEDVEALLNVYTHYVEAKSNPPRMRSGAAVIPQKEVQRLLDLTKETRNIILYGPPGTGKTYWSNLFAQEFLSSQLASKEASEQQRSEVLQSLTWYEAIALTMTLDLSDQWTKVPPIVSSSIIQEYLTFKNNNFVKQSVHANLQTHADRTCLSVTTQRQEPLLFEKNDQSQWHLTNSGKEWIESNLAEEIAVLTGRTHTPSRIEEFYRFVTFHQSFSYEEFIEGLRPRTDEVGSITYSVEPGVFKSISNLAEAAYKKHKEKAPNYLLVIDEINRGNISKVFGELITLIEDDKRIDQENEIRVTLPYSQDSFGVPPNLFILGTMNTADRSIALFDIALRRRFSFFEMRADPAVLAGQNVAGIPLDALLARLNLRIGALLSRDYHIGHSYFKKVDNINRLRFVWYDRIIPLLKEYFYNSGEALAAVLGCAFILEAYSSDKVFETVPDVFDSDHQMPEINTFEADNEGFISALLKIVG
ncbi:MAG: hypothetical protein JWL77_1857 [Chthonomonadaceae bacterium]|nr:hypothetical protein [Chthonomonadaceae bacterium]